MTKLIGLRTDHLPIEQPKEAARFVLNGVLDSPDGNTMNYQNELGTDLVKQLTYTPIGAINLPDNNVVIFSTDNTTSEIGLFNKGDYTAIVTSTCLGFSTSKMIRGEFKLLNGCDRVVYWGDNLNPDRQFNLDDPESYQDSTGNWDCNLFKLNPDYTVPYISNLIVNDTGGDIEAGAYAFAIEILDDNLNSITVGLATNYIPIYDDNQSSSYNSINGSFSSSTNSVEGGTESTSKSITLTLDNLDTRFTYARILVSVKTSGRFFAEEAYELTDFIPISKNILEYTFTGLQSVTRVDIDKFRIRNPKYTTSKAITQVDGRLVRANVKEVSRDYTAYQRFANGINAQWRRVSEFPEDIEEVHNTKNPESYFNGTTFLPDEIYAFGIVYIYSDGSFSPVFHIPGRAANATDLTELTVVDGPTTGNNVSVDDVAHLGLSVGDTIQRWKFYNTYTGVLTGDFGYHESTSGTYPLDVDCDGYSIYAGLAGTPIRHHKFPDSRNIPNQSLNSSNQTRVNKFGVEFSNIVYPDTDIVGHFFVKAKRTESDSTVVDTGLLGCPLAAEYVSFPDVNANYLFAYEEYTGANQETTVKSFTSPKILAGINANGSYIKLNYSIPESSFEEIDTTRDSIEVNSFDIKFDSTVSQLDAIYRNIEDSVLLDINTVYNGDFDKPVVNYSLSNRKLVIDLNENIQSVPEQSVVVATLKRIADPYNNIYQLQYEPITTILELSDDQRSYSGGGFTNLFNYFNLYSTSVERTGFLNLSSGVKALADYYSGIIVPSDINYELFVEGTDCNTIYDESQNLALFTLTKIATYDGSNWKLRSGACPEYYALNADYNVASAGEIFLPVPFNFDYCSECLNQYPNRIIWSPKSFSEEKSDAYRINLVNDYVVVGENKGEINIVHYDKNRMLVITNETCLLMSPNPRVINTDLDTAYIGTGDFLGIPPAEFAKTDYGFGGCQSRFANVNTEFGFFWCDQKAGRIFVFNGNIDELSSKQYGNYAFFRQNLSANISGDSTVDGTGMQMSYDPYYKRVVLHKADFKLIGTADGDYTNQDNYENTGFTLSYSPEFRSWISFHSWQPEFMFSDRDQFYSTTGQTVWKHSKFQSEFYGRSFPFTVEFVSSNPVTNVLDVVAYYAQTVDQNGLDKAYPTFDTIWCYSGDQSTGEQNLIPKSDYPRFWSNVQKVVVHAEDNYRISALRDISIGSTVVSSDWDDKKIKYFGKQGYIDKVPVNTEVDAPQWNQIPLRNKYHIIRLSYSGGDRIILNLTETATIPSVL